MLLYRRSHCLLSTALLTLNRTFLTTTTASSRPRSTFTMGKQKAKKSEKASAAPPPRNNAPAVPITSAPADNQNVQHPTETDTIFTTVKEGLAYILIPPDAPRLLDPKTHANEPAQSVFYNPIQQYNRDLTVLAIRAFGEDYLARTSLSRKKRKNKRPAKKGEENGAGEEVNGEEEVVQEVQYTPPVGESAPNKRKLGDEAAVEAGIDAKRQKVTTEAGEFEDGGIDDEDLLAVESSMQEAPPASAAAQATPNGTSKPNDPPNETSGAAKAPPAPQEQDARPPFRILDALSATGLRALRYARELPFNTHVTANDLSKSAAAAIKLNIQHNGLSHRIKTTIGNANAHMYSFVAQEGIGGGGGHKYHVIDLDPYGTAVPFLDAAVQAVADGGMLCVTCTDTGVFNSMGYAEKAFALYGGVPGKGDHCHEIGLRLILHAITTTAAKYGISIEPLLSLSIDYYARVFVKVRKSPADVKFLASKTMLVYTCDHGCGAWYPQFLMRAAQQEGRNGQIWFKHSVGQGPSTERLCECCGSKMHVAGPMWGSALHNPTFVSRILDMIPEVDKEVYKTLPRVEGMLSLALEETMIQDAPKLLVPVEQDKEIQAAKRNEEAERAEAKKAQEEKNAAIAAEHPNGQPPPRRGHRRNSSSPIPELASHPQTFPRTTTTEISTSHTSKMYQSLQSSFLDHHPFYIIPSSLSRTIHCQAPPDAAFRGALKGLGYQVVRSHAQAGTIKTDAPWDAIWDVMVAWTKQEGKGIREGAVSETSAGWGVLRRAEEREERRRVEREARERKEKDKKEKEALEKEGPEGMEIDAGGGIGEEANGDTGHQKPEKRKGIGERNIVFDEALGHEPPKSKRLVMYQINPRANWGPMARAK